MRSPWNGIHSRPCQICYRDCPPKYWWCAMRLTKIDAPLLRRDDSVGTRIFAGNTMIHGDTGWRDITSLMLDGISPSNTGRILVRRTLNTVDVRFDIVTIPAGVGLLTMGTLPGGFRPTGRYGSSSLSIQNSAAKYQNVSIDSSGRVWWFSETAVTSSPSQTPTRPADPIVGLISFSADNWPTSLPGTPA